jgi:menaquinone-dependent protoporphyrinogen oxidase
VPDGPCPRPALDARFRLSDHDAKEAEMGARRVLIAYATKHGTMAEVSETIADELRHQGLQVDVQRVEEAADITWYDGVVVGSALYMGRWRGEAIDFLRRHRDELAARPVWLFHGGPLSFDPETFEQRLPDGVVSLANRIGVRGVVTVGGRLLPGTPGFVEGLMLRGGTAGDFVDHDQIRAWAREIASELHGALAVAQ